MAAPASLIPGLARPLLLAGALLAAALGAGFAWFAADAARPAPPPPASDGIVVLTGGAGRVELALRLLAERRAARLLVSGTGRGELADIIAAAGLEPAVSARIAPAQVTLGRDARSTRGNARETADWAAAHDMGSLIVVTSGYHMRRALWELRRTLPAAVQLRPAPLVPHLPDGQDHVPLRLLASEYAKWLGAMAGLSAWVAREEEASAPAPAMQRPTQ
jgi:uncharacterized SAM-binding protein YcdF (DUF218 family)